MSATLTHEAEDAIAFVKEFKILDDANIKVLYQLFSHRLDEELVASMVHGKERMIAATLLKVAGSSANPTIVGFVLRFFADLAQISKPLCHVLATANVAETFEGVDPAEKFYEMAKVHADVAGIANPAVFLLATVLRFSAPGQREVAIDRFLSHCGTVFSAATLTLSDVEYTVHSISIFIRRRELRTKFFDAGLVSQIPRILIEACSGDSSAVVQVTYEALLTTWVLSFDYSCLMELARCKIIATVHRVLQRVIKEKCIRMCLMIFKNFSAAHRKYYNAIANQEITDPNLYLLGACNKGKGPSFYSDLIGVGLMKTLWQLSRKKFGDVDILPDVEELSHVLEANLDQMTSFSEYRGEVQSGVLEWSHVHTSVKFWRENVAKFEENQYEVLRDLAGLLSTSKSELTLAVTCHDIGEVIRYHPTGRLLLNIPQLQGVKEKVMGLMSHPNVEVSKHALLAVQKIMVQKWEFIK